MAGMFATRHYVALAKVISEAFHGRDGKVDGPDLVENITDMLAKDNPLFNREKFKEAAGI